MIIVILVRKFARHKVRLTRKYTDVQFGCFVGCSSLYYAYTRPIIKFQLKFDDFGGIGFSRKPVIMIKTVTSSQDCSKMVDSCYHNAFFEQIRKVREATFFLAMLDKSLELVLNLYFSL